MKNNNYNSKIIKDNKAMIQLQQELFLDKVLMNMTLKAIVQNLKYKTYKK